jgi:glucose-6-phosphate 1-dehydrogenase
MIRTILMLGATGDLARRHLLPALGALAAAGRLPEGFRVIGAARARLEQEDVRRLAGDALPAHMLTYEVVDPAQPSSLAAPLAGAQEPVAVYLALPPGVFATTIESLGRVGLPPGSRIVVEKPFGDDLESARTLNSLLAQTGIDAFRVDHVLGMETTRNLVAMRRENPVVERLWSAESIERVEILWEETLALEGRAGYYDHAGALKDVMQNHMLQLLCLVGMALPENEHDLQARKLDVLRAARPGNSHRARYIAGTLPDGRSVPAYADEDGVDPRRCTETFAEVALKVDVPRWSGTLFVLRAGKALARRRKLVLLHFRGGGELELGIDGPEEVALGLAVGSGDPIRLRASAPEGGLPAYAHVFLDVLDETSTLSVSGAEAEQAWRVVAPVLAAWGSGDVPIGEYAAGSTGPAT